jgi:hypothetical protein
LQVTRLAIKFLLLILVRVTQLAAILLSINSAAQNYNYYFGNLHAHTALSDGNKDSVSSGISQPSGSYAYAKLSDDFDFLGISEHNHYSSSKNPGFRRPLYQLGLNQANSANDENNFLALFGMEYGVSSEYNGHVIIYGFNDLLGWESSAPGVTGNNYDVYNGKTDYAGLFTKIKNNPTAFCYLAHPSFSDFSTEGTWETALANAPYNAGFDSAIIGMPLRSGLANSTATDYSDYSLSNYFNYYKKMLYNGYHLGIGYDHDNHYSNFGRSNGGRLVILAPSLTKNNLFAAMKNRNFYGSDDANAMVSFKVNGHIMGSIAKEDGYPTIEVMHNDPNGEMADSIKLWKGRANSGGLWANHISTWLQVNNSVFTDTYVTPGSEYYYFAEIRQADGQWIVTSPVWYTPLSITSVNKQKQVAFSVSFNSVRRQISISSASDIESIATLLDITGRTVSSEQLFSKQLLIDVSALAPGLYILQLGGEKNERRKILLD